MLTERIIVGSSGNDELVRTVARRLRDAGQEVVFVGGDQTPAHFVRAAIAEDAICIVVDTDDKTIREIADLCIAWGSPQISVARPV